MNDNLRQKFINSCHNVVVNTNPWGAYYFMSWAADYKYDIHNHPYFQAIQVLEGQLKVDYGKGWKMVEHNSVHILPPGHMHKLRTVAGHRQFVIEFTSKDDELGLLNAMRRAFPLPTVCPMYFHAFWEENLKKGFPLGDSARLRTLNALMDWTISLIESMDDGKNDLEAMRLVELLKTWSHRSVSITDVAGKLSWSERKSQRICKRRFGCGIAQLHKKLRIEEAERMLLNSDLNVGEVAGECGFDDIYGFSRAFTKTAGVSPSAFRRKIRKG